jgi:hypothetical protein
MKINNRAFKTKKHVVKTPARSTARAGPKVPLVRATSHTHLLVSKSLVNIHARIRNMLATYL